jgi:hypothetical protein
MINMAANERFTPTTSAMFSYSFSHNPFLVQPHLASVPGAALLLVNPADQHNFSLSFLTSPRNGIWSLNISSTYQLPTQSQSYSTALNYRLSPMWHIGMDDYLNRLEGLTYQDLDVSLARRIGDRDLVLYWDTLEHRFRFNMEAAQL